MRFRPETTISISLLYYQSGIPLGTPEISGFNSEISGYYNKKP